MLFLHILLSVLLGLVVLLALLLVLPVALLIEYRKTLKVILSIGPIRLNLTKRFLGQKPTKEKTVKLSDSLEKKKTPKHKKTGKQKKETEEKEAEPALRGIGDVKAVVQTVFRLLAAYLKIRVAELNIVVGGKEAAGIAVKYGAYHAAAGTLMLFLSQIRNFSLCKKKMRIEADFLATETKADIKLRFTIFVWQIAVSAIKLGVIYFKMKDHKESENAQSTKHKEQNS